ncbi:MAG TPA: hypothetical protein V6C78_00380 [Crinalium sp.]|jgi:hypothetical protein
MPILIDYQNKQVRLTEERLAHILAHSEMVGMEAQIADTLSNPQLVRRSRSDDSVALFYRLYTQTVIGDKWLCIVVKYLPNDAFIVTAYFTDKPKQGEELWHSK